MPAPSRFRGCPFKLSPTGEVGLPRHKHRRGVIIGESHSKTCWVVRFHGYKTEARLHKSFVEILALPEEVKPAPKIVAPPEPPPVPVMQPTIAFHIHELRKRGWSRAGIAKRLELPMALVADKLGVQLERRA